MADRHIGNYLVLEEIGQGGMAVVYRAVQESLQRPVAIKVLKDEFCEDDQVTERFQREAFSVAALQHENIVHVYDYIVNEDGHHIIMELVGGINLFDLLSKTERLPPVIAGIVALQLARALEYAHFRGVVHRDIKPSNIVISTLGEVKLMDFGIARAEVLGDLTRPGVALGTPSYMSPEQIMGERVDWRSDVFSFGIVLFQMLTGRKPFSETDQRTVMQSILQDSYPDPSTLNPDIPGTLLRIVNRCLEKKPERRFESTEALRVALETFVAKTVRISIRGRLVAFLHHRGQLSEEEALTVLTRDILGEASLARADSAEVASMWRPRMTPVVLAAAIGLMTVAGGTAAAEWWPGSAAEESYVAEARGFLRINVWPWARVSIDNQYVDTTPFMRVVPLAPGEHTIELRNEYFKDERHMVEIAADRTTTFNVELATRKETGP